MVVFVNIITSAIGSSVTTTIVIKVLYNQDLVWNSRTWFNLSPLSGNKMCDPQIKCPNPWAEVIDQISHWRDGFRCQIPTLSPHSLPTGFTFDRCISTAKFKTTFPKFVKSFWQVNNAILLTKLNHYGIRGDVREWFKSYSPHCEQFVIASGHFHPPSLPWFQMVRPLLFMCISPLVRSQKSLVCVDRNQWAVFFGQNQAEVTLNLLQDSQTNFLSWITKAQQYFT